MNKKLNINQMQAGFANWHLDKKGAMILMASIMVARGSSFIFSKWLLWWYCYLFGRIKCIEFFLIL